MTGAPEGKISIVSIVFIVNLSPIYYPISNIITELNKFWYPTRKMEKGLFM